MEWWLALRIEIVLESEVRKIPLVETVRLSGLGEDEGDFDFVEVLVARAQRRCAANEPEVLVILRSQSDWPVEIRTWRPYGLIVPNNWEVVSRSNRLGYSS
jgi:hypothetical protein